MGQVALSLNGRMYRLACEDGEEERLRALAACVKSKLTTLIDEFGQVGETRLMVMAALLLADDLLDSQPSLATLDDQGDDLTETDAPKGKK
ncbi:MAG: cell division protein ZapA [Alphaproteobacteria bacterium]|nr:cell division protein ZapA [Alphaproteobacteria bacterium]